MKRIGWIEGLMVAGAIGLIAWFIPWPLVFSPTWPTGGDTPTHYATLVHFVKSILPHWRLWGWDPGNLAGFPQFQFYFPLPFLFMAGLGQLTGLAVAFKLGALLPALALPGAAWFCLRRLRAPAPGPGLGAVFLTAFVLAQKNQVWGGNLASILAGEIAYAWGLVLALVYLGLAVDWLTARRSSRSALIWPSVLLALTGLSHAYALLFCLTAGLYFVIVPGHRLRSGLRLLAVYGLAFLLLGLWVIPMLAYTGYTEMFNFVWVIDSWTEFLPPTLGPVLIAAGVGSLAWWRWMSAEERRAWGFLAFGAVMAVSLYFLAPLMNTITVRFMPFAQVAAALIAAQTVGLMAARLPRPAPVALALALGLLVWTGYRVDYLTDWLAWNNAGSQATPAWPEVERLSDYLAHSYPDDQGWTKPRVVYEHSPLNDSAGSVRVFEALPLLAGRATLETAYLQAGPNAPFAFYIQSLVSQRGSSPLPGYPYGRFDLKRALPRLAAYNVGQYIVVEPATKAAADKCAGLILEREFGRFSVYRVADNPGRYVDPPPTAPLVVVTDRPRRLAYDWFRFTDLKTPLVFVRRPPPAPPAWAAGVVIDSGPAGQKLLSDLRTDRLPRKKSAGYRPTAQVTAERIELTGLEPGRPVVVRVAYHPAWRSPTGEKIWRVSPAFMLIVPQSDRLALEFGPAWPHWLGLALTGLGLVLIGLIVIRPGLLVWPRLHRPGRDGHLRRWVVVGVAIVWLGGLMWLGAGHDDAITLLTAGRQAAGRGDQAAAQTLFRAGLARFPRSSVADYLLYELALSYYHGEGFKAAETYLARLDRDYPDSIVLPETLYHLHLCAARTGDKAAAAEYARRLRTEFPNNDWTKRLKD